MQKKSKLPCWKEMPWGETSEDETPYGEWGHVEENCDALYDSQL